MSGLRHISEISKAPRPPQRNVIRVVMDLDLEIDGALIDILWRAVQKQHSRGRTAYGMGDAAKDVLAWVARFEAQNRGGLS